MNDFNAKLASDPLPNNPVGIAFTVAGEADAIPVPVPWVKFTIKIPFGAEYISANSKTNHTVNGTTTTVNWNLPAFGVYVSPRLSVHFESLQINFRPVGVGYYWLGQTLGAAQLVVSDRPGSLDANSTAFGYLGILGVEYSVAKTSLLFEGGRRHLSFTDVSLAPKGNFTQGAVGSSPVVVLAGHLPETLDYSGWMLRAGVGFRF
jgi:hypothetical protein